MPAVQEARERVRSAIRNAGFEFPLRRITPGVGIRIPDALGEVGTVAADDILDGRRGCLERWPHRRGRGGLPPISARARRRPPDRDLVLGSGSIGGSVRTQGSLASASLIRGMVRGR